MKLSLGLEQEELSCAHVGTVPVDVDWQETLGENLDGWTAYEAVECPNCGGVAVAHGIWEHHCEECDTESGGIFEGPMMNHLYPCDISDPPSAAELLLNLPVCVVQFADGSTGLALTGGGMDLSWEICEAYIRLGYLPPAHFSELPAMAGYPRTDDQRIVLRACRVSLEVAANWAKNALERFDSTFGTE